MKKSLICLNSDTYSSIAVSIFQKFVADNFTNAVSDIDSNKKNIEKLIHVLKEQEFEFDVINYDISITNYSSIIISKENDWMYVVASETAENVTVTTYGNTLQITEKMFNIFKPFQTVNEQIHVKIYSYFINNQGQLDRNVSYKEEKDFNDVSKLYYPFLDTDEMFKQFILSSESILVLGGKPGTGKTNIINLCMNYAIKNYELFEELEGEESPSKEPSYSIKVAYIKNVDILAMDSFWNELTDDEFDFVVLDDIDFMLIDRQLDNNEDVIRKRFISQLLSFTDGIFENNTKFIITSNQEISMIDKAILRKGRTFDVLQFRDLTKNEALNIWKEAELDMSVFDSTFNKDVISACDLGSAIELSKAMTKKGEEQKKYILEDNISIYSENNSISSIKL